jgi:hypothetical protein
MLQKGVLPDKEEDLGDLSHQYTSSSVIPLSSHLNIFVFHETVAVFLFLNRWAFSHFCRTVWWQEPIAVSQNDTNFKCCSTLSISETDLETPKVA